MVIILIVGAGAVVTKSFREGNIALGGAPAKVIKHYLGEGTLYFKENEI